MLVIYNAKNSQERTRFSYERLEERKAWVSSENCHVKTLWQEVLFRPEKIVPNMQEKYMQSEL
jgi:hypothetical protein